MRDYVKVLNELETARATVERLDKEIRSHKKTGKVSLKGFKIKDEVKELMTGMEAHVYLALPIERTEDELIIVVSDKKDKREVEFTADDMRFMHNCDIRVLKADDKELRAMINKVYGKQETIRGLEKYEKPVHVESGKGKAAKSVKVKGE